MATNEIPDYVLAWLSLDAKRELALKATNGGALLWQCSIRDRVGCLGCAASVSPSGAIESAVTEAVAFLDRRRSAATPPPARGERGWRVASERYSVSYHRNDQQALPPWMVTHVDSQDVIARFWRHGEAIAYANIANTGATAADAALGREVAKAAAALGVEAERVPVELEDMLAVMKRLAFARSDASRDAKAILARLSPAPAEDWLAKDLPPKHPVEAAPAEGEGVER